MTMTEYKLEYIVKEEDRGMIKHTMEEGDITAESVGNKPNNERNHMVFSKALKKITVVFLAITIPFLVIIYISSADHFQDFLLRYPFYSPLNRRTQGNHSSPNFNANISSQEKNKLMGVLKNAATVNKTVIITTLNAAWTEPNSIFDLFRESFKIGDETEALLDHLVVVAMDQKAYSRCLELHPNCYALTTEGVDFSGKATYMSEHYMKMMWRRLDFMRIVLEMGYNFIFTDSDIMWFRNPFPRFYMDTDFQIACDRYSSDSTDLHNWPNGGFMYVQSNNRTLQFYKFWYASKFTYPTKNEQDVFNIIKFDPLIKNIGLSIRFLDTAYFGGFCEPSKDLNLVCTMHANCCFSVENKIHDLKMLIEDWKKYRELPPQVRKSNPPTWSGPRSC